MSGVEKLNIGKILDRRNLLKVVDNQIVSTKIANNDEVTLELYAFGKGQDIQGHKLLNQSFYFVLSGNIQIGNYLVKELDYVFLNVGDNAYIKAKEDSTILIYTFKTKVNFNELEKNCITHFQDNITFVQNSVASKTLVQNKLLSMTLFAISNGEGLSTHAASGDAIVIPLEGSVDIKIDDKLFKLDSYNMIVLPKGIPHSLDITSDYKMLLTVIRD